MWLVIAPPRNNAGYFFAGRRRYRGMLWTGSAAVVGQIVGGDIGFVLALDRHLPGTGGVAAYPGDRHDLRIDHHRRSEGENLSLDDAVGAIAERNVNRACLNQDRTDEIVDDLFGWRQSYAGVIGGKRLQYGPGQGDR